MRSRGDAAWCVRKHATAAKKHMAETNQKLGRNLNVKRNRVKLDKATRDEANAIIEDIDQIEYHIQNEVLPQVRKHSTKRQLREIDKQARKIRQQIAQTGVIFHDRKFVSENAMDVLEKQNRQMKKLIVKIDKTASHIMTQEQIHCSRCVEDLIGPEGLRSLKKKGKVENISVKKHWFGFGEKKGKRR